MKIRRTSTWVFFWTLLACLPLVAVDSKTNPRLSQLFQAALGEYNSGRFADAASHLEALLPQAPESFDVHELLGFVYSAESLEAKATDHFKTAVRLKPNSAAARTNLAANLARLGRLDAAEKEFNKAIELEPRNFDANHNLGELYVRAGKISQAVPFLAQAQRIMPSAYDNGYDLAQAYLVTKQYVEARRTTRDLLSRKETAELHNLLGQIEEADANHVAAANEFEAAAHIDPSETNLFDWGSELLVHRTLEPAIEVFRSGTGRYPNSSRLAIGLGMALYARGNYDEAVKSLLRAADLSPSDPGCYLFLSKAYDSSPNQAEDVIQRFRRYAELQPNNARALYYYALSLWKGKRTQDAVQSLDQIQALLSSAVTLDPSFAEAHLQLGNLYSDEKKYAESIPEYLKAIEYKADLADAHYRLGQAYVRTDARDRAQEQFEIYQRLRTQQMAELDQRRAEIRQFVYSTKDTAVKP
ncbi:MAG TPA: tetratricopeptide repeat protein [Terriglobales bacterium]|nr:tetratricopeptide repeat protein [Terriglobales bacterium]